MENAEDQGRRDMTKATGLVVACLAVVVAITGCGGGGDSATASAPIPRQQYLDRVNQLCKEREVEKFALIGKAFRLRAAAEPGWEPEQKDLEDTVTHVVLPVMKRVVREIDEMPPPATRQAGIEQMLADFESDIEKTETEPKRYIDGVAFTSGNEDAEAYNLRLCLF
jgi:hypothetical protein